MRPTISVVIAACNAAATLGATLSGALTQTMPVDEIVVVDDGSTDSTAAVAEAHGQRVRVVVQTNAGVASARNRGLAEAKGDLVTFIDADDYWLPRCVERMVEQRPAGKWVAAANAYYLRANGLRSDDVRLRGRFPRSAQQRRAILEENFVPSMSLFPRTMIAEIGGFDESLAVAEDWDLWLRAIYAGWRVAVVPEPVGVQRRTQPSLSTDVERMDSWVLRVLEKTLGTLDLSDEERAYVDRRLVSTQPGTLIRDGEAALRRGDYAEGALSLRAAAELCPSDTRLLAKARLLRAGGPVAARLLAVDLRRSGR
jgi:glycosyltransferase involved in cell wall biosynthesis